MVGSRISHYRIVSELGRGGMGIVYQAVDEKLDRTVALKFLSPHLSTDPESKARFILEAKSASILDHQNICNVHEIGETDDGQIFIAMACYAGRTIRQMMVDGALPPENAIEYGIQIADGLEAAHEAGIVHRDIKPGNVMVAEHEVVKILDFGLAKVSDLSISSTGIRLGTVHYMSPEQARGEHVDTRTDTWSLGAVMYEMLTGEPPFTAPYEAAILYSITNVDPVPLSTHNPDIPQGLEDIVLRCLAKNPSERYQSAVEIADDLKRFRDGSASIAATEHRLESTRKRMVKRMATFGIPAMAVLLLLLLIPSAWNTIRSQEEPFPQLNGLAVLPHDGATVASGDQVLVDGVLAFIGDRLEQFERLKPSIWARPYRDVIRRGVVRPIDAVQRLYVRHVIVPGVNLDEDAIRIDLTLIEPETLETVGSEQFNARISEPGDLEGKITEKLAKLLNLNFSSSVLQELGAGGTSKPDAFLNYLRGQGALQRYETEGNVDLAIGYFNSALDGDSLFVLAGAQLGYAYWRKFYATGNREWMNQALSTVEYAVGIDSSVSSVHALRGYFLRRMNRSVDAEREFRRSLELDSTNRLGYQRLAEVLESQNRMVEFEQVYLEAIQARPDYWEFYLDLGIHYARHSRHAEAAAQFRRVIELVPSHAWAYNNLAAQYQALGTPGLADSMYQRAIVVNESATSARSYAFHNLAVIRYDEDNFLSAADMYQRSLDLDSMLTAGWAGLGDVYHWLGRDQEASQMWKKAVQLAEDELNTEQEAPRSLRLLALSQAKLGLKTAALYTIKRMHSLDPLLPEQLEGIGKTYEILGYRREALQFIHQALNEGYSVSILESSRWLDDLRLDRRYLCRFTGDPC